MKLNEYEKAFKSVVEDAAHWVHGENELEVHHLSCTEGLEPGWYAYEYDGSYIHLLNGKPLISDKTAERYNVRVKEILNNSGVLWSM